MEPPPRSLALDAHYCIMVRVSHGPPNTSTRARSVALAGELPSVSTPCRPRPATGDPTQNRWPLRSLGRDEDMVVLRTNNEVKRPEPSALTEITPYKWLELGSAERPTRSNRGRSERCRS